MADTRTTADDDRVEARVPFGHPAPPHRTRSSTDPPSQSTIRDYGKRWEERPSEEPGPRSTGGFPALIFLVDCTKAVKYYREVPRFGWHYVQCSCDGVVRRRVIRSDTLRSCATSDRDNSMTDAAFE